MATSLPLTWRWKRWFWARWQVARFKLSNPQKIGQPRPNTKHLGVKPLGELHKGIPLREVVGVERLPKEESRLAMRVMASLALFFDRVLPPMRPGLPEIASDGDQALADASITTYAKAFRAPVRPSVYATTGPPDLGALAVESPYAVLTERGADGELQWDLHRLGDFAHHEGLCSLGLRVVFSSPGPGSLAESRIESRELDVVASDEPGWPQAVRLAICAATTHVALTRHFNYVHLISGNHWDVATRNALPTDHPLYRLVWPHIFNSFYTNHGVTRVQMVPTGDFVNMFSFTHEGLMAYFDEMYRSYDIAVTDPVADWTRRGLGTEAFDCPTHTNLVELFDVMHAHASRYIDAYYDSDEQLRADPAVRAGLDELGTLVPGGLGGVDDGVTKAGLARLVAGYIHEGNTIHDLVWTTLWDYQLWADCNPVRVCADGTRMPVDVFQRVVNNNFALQLRRAPMLADYGNVALDDRGAALFTQLYDECRALQERYDAVPAGPWRMEPKNLEINMNG